MQSAAAAISSTTGRITGQEEAKCFRRSGRSVNALQIFIIMLQNELFWHTSGKKYLNQRKMKVEFWLLGS